MSLSLTEEQEELRSLVRRFLDDKSPTPRAQPPGGSPPEYDTDLWGQISGTLGLTGIGVPEEYGGAGLGTAGLAVVLEEMGRSLYAGPFFATAVLAGTALAHCGDEEARRRWLTGIAAGGLTATLATAEPGIGWEDTPSTAARPDGAGWALSGTKTYVVDGHSADLVLVSARHGDDVGLFALPSDAPGIQRTRLDALDDTRPLTRIDLDAAPATRIGAGDSRAELAVVRDVVRAALAAEQVGGAAACLDMAVEYATTREQFGRPIGSFQAVKHKCAQLLVEVECARSAARFAASAVGRADDEASIAASVARAYCSGAFTHAAKENIQIHGGIGFTWEHAAHLYLRRAKASELLFSTPRQERARLARLTTAELTPSGPAASGAPTSGPATSGGTAR
ncbi:acyl-CoA dehydrogenase family protein [Streptomyces sp. NPDC023723]|uniref:acyl-CoA dehydrogenase family protein n=1 Tax=Streptomyces sp. NPDC023723 TaxID=3154323 RepID=UPI0033F1F3F4